MFVQSFKAQNAKYNCFEIKKTFKNGSLAQMEKCNEAPTRLLLAFKLLCYKPKQDLPPCVRRGSNSSQGPHAGREAQRFRGQTFRRRLKMIEILKQDPFEW